ncbi:MAG: SDR family oxidoreductase [Pseudomonadota bacterium]
MIDLTGKTALITGASRGIGAATARRLAEAGAAVVLAARTKKALRDVEKEINKSGGAALAAPCDVADFASVERVVLQAERTLGGLDILVSNAGVIDPIARLEDSDPAAWSRAVDINLKGVYYGLRAAAPAMKRRGGGVIVNISSGAANSALEGWSAYCASKAAAKKLTECAHGELGDAGARAAAVRVVGLSPGTVATDMMARIKESGVNPVSRLDWSSHIPPEWVAQAVLFLCGPDGAAFAGTDFSIKTDKGRRLVGLPPLA